MAPRDLATLLILAAIWGSSFLFIRVGVGDLPPMAVVELRLVLGALAAALLAARMRTPGIGAAMRRPLVALTGLCAAGIPFTLYALGETRVPSGIAGISNATAPLFAAVIARALPLRLGGERFGAARVAGLLVGFAGVVILAADGIGGALDPWGLAACVAAPVFYGIGGVLARHAYRGVDSTVSAVAGTGLAAVILLPVAAPLGIPTHVPGAGTMLAVAVLGVAGTGLAFVLFYRLLARIGSVAFTVTYLMPVVAVAEGALFLGERVRAADFVALAAILAGVALSGGLLRRRRAPRPAPASQARAELAPSVCD